MVDENINLTTARTVRCPKCTSVLIEPPSPIFECPKCATLLLAKGRQPGQLNRNGDITQERGQETTGMENGNKHVDAEEGNYYSLSFKYMKEDTSESVSDANIGLKGSKSKAIVPETNPFSLEILCVHRDGGDDRFDYTLDSGSLSLDGSEVDFGFPTSLSKGTHAEDVLSKFVKTVNLSSSLDDSGSQAHTLNKLQQDEVNGDIVGKQNLVSNPQQEDLEQNACQDASDGVVGLDVCIEEDEVNAISGHLSDIESILCPKVGIGMKVEEESLASTSLEPISSKNFVSEAIGSFEDALDVPSLDASTTNHSTGPLTLSSSEPSMTINFHYGDELQEDKGGTVSIPQDNQNCTLSVFRDDPDVNQHPVVESVSIIEAFEHNALKEGISEDPFDEMIPCQGMAPVVSAVSDKFCSSNPVVSNMQSQPSEVEDDEESAEQNQCEVRAYASMQDDGSRDRSLDATEEKCLVGTVGGHSRMQDSTSHDKSIGANEENDMDGQAAGHTQDNENYDTSTDPSEENVRDVQARDDVAMHDIGSHDRSIDAREENELDGYDTSLSFDTRDVPVTKDDLPFQASFDEWKLPRVSGHQATSLLEKGESSTMIEFGRKAQNLMERSSGSSQQPGFDRQLYNSHVHGWNVGATDVQDGLEYHSPFDNIKGVSESHFAHHATPRFCMPHIGHAPNMESHCPACLSQQASIATHYDYQDSCFHTGQGQTYSREHDSTPVIARPPQYTHQYSTSSQLLVQSKHYPLPSEKAAPYIICQHCNNMLQIPAHIPQSNGSIQKLRCGACRRVSKFSVYHEERYTLLGSNKPILSRQRAHLSYGGRFLSASNYESYSKQRNWAVQPHAHAFGFGLHEPSHKMPGRDEILKSRTADEDLFHHEVSSDNSRDFSETGLGFAHNQMGKQPLGRSSGTKIQMGTLNGRPPRPTNHIGHDVNFALKNLMLEESESTWSPASDSPLYEQPLHDASSDFDDSGSGKMHNTIKGGKFFSGLLKRSLRDIGRGQMNHDRRKVFVNGMWIPDDAVKRAEEEAGPISPGSYWYDCQAGFWGVTGGPCLGIIPPFIEELNFPLDRGCSRGTTRILVNGRELHEKDLKILANRGLPSTPGIAYHIDITGRIYDEVSGQYVRNLGNLAPTVQKRGQGFGMFQPEG